MLCAESEAPPLVEDKLTGEMLHDTDRLGDKAKE